MTVAILAIVLAAPVILLPIALILYINIGGVLAAREARKAKAEQNTTF